MANTFVIPNDAYNGFDALIRIGGEKLVALAHHANGKELTLDIESLIEHLATATGIDEGDLGEAVDSALAPLSGVRADFRMSADRFVELLTGLIAGQDPEWFEANHSGWEGVAPKLVTLLAPDTLFSQLNKAYRLLMNRPALVSSVRLLTELRPVYDDDVTKVNAYLVTSTMSVNYQASGRQRRIHLTLDQKDLEQLQEQVSRAIKKIELLEQQVAVLGVPSLVAGTERN